MILHFLLDIYRQNSQPWPQILYRCHFERKVGFHLPAQGKRNPCQVQFKMHNTTSSQFQSGFMSDIAQHLTNRKTYLRPFWIGAYQPELTPNSQRFFTFVFVQRASQSKPMLLDPPKVEKKATLISIKCNCQIVKGTSCNCHYCHNCWSRELGQEMLHR